MADERTRPTRREDRSREPGTTAGSREFGAWPYGAGFMSPGYMGYPGYTSYPWGRAAHGMDPYREEHHPGKGESGGSFGWSPRTEMFERDDKLVVRAELPGLDKDDVNVWVEGDRLVIEGERREEESDRGDRYYQREWSYGYFHREIPLPEQVDDHDVKAKFKNGILEVSVPRSERMERRTIHIDT